MCLVRNVFLKIFLRILLKTSLTFNQTYFFGAKIYDHRFSKCFWNKINGFSFSYFSVTFSKTDMIYMYTQNEIDNKLWHKHRNTNTQKNTLTKICCMCVTRIYFSIFNSIRWTHKYFFFFFLIYRVPSLPSRWS